MASCANVTKSEEPLGVGRGQQNQPDGGEEKVEGWAAPALGAPCSPITSDRSTGNTPYALQQEMDAVLPVRPAPGGVASGSQGNSTP